MSNLVRQLLAKVENLCLKPVYMYIYLYTSKHLRSNPWLTRAFHGLYGVVLPNVMVSQQRLACTSGNEQVEGVYPPETG